VTATFADVQEHRGRTAYRFEIDEDLPSDGGPLFLRPERDAGTEGVIARGLRNIKALTTRIDRVSTVDGFQGNEADLAVLSLVRNNSGTGAGLSCSLEVSITSCSGRPQRLWDRLPNRVTRPGKADECQASRPFEGTERPLNADGSLRFSVQRTNLNFS
jgi:hypothetical protein